MRIGTNVVLATFGLPLLLLFKLLSNASSVSEIYLISLYAIVAVPAVLTAVLGKTQPRPLTDFVDNVALASGLKEQIIS